MHSPEFSLEARRCEEMAPAVLRGSGESGTAQVGGEAACRVQVGLQAPAGRYRESIFL